MYVLETNILVIKDIAYFYLWTTNLNFKIGALHYMVVSQFTVFIILGSYDLILVVG